MRKSTTKSTGKSSQKKNGTTSPTKLTTDESIESGSVVNDLPSASNSKLKKSQTVSGKNFRASMMVNQDSFKQRESVANTIARASSQFGLNGSGDKNNAKLVVENERLKTSIMVLTQKL
jgi:hypothetical protein